MDLTGQCHINISSHHLPIDGTYTPFILSLLSYLSTIVFVPINGTFTPFIIWILSYSSTIIFVPINGTSNPFILSLLSLRFRMKTINWWIKQFKQN